MILFSLKFFIYEPKCLLLMSLSYNFSELLKKHQAARSSRGVVGKIGRKIPMTPNDNDMIPNNKSSIFMFCVFS